FRVLLEHPVYWALNRRNVTRAFALGVFLAFVPLPGSFLLAAILALILRLNVPAAVAGTLVNNPLTMVPLFFSAYWVGTQLLGAPGRAADFHVRGGRGRTGLLPIWSPFLLGCLVMGVLSALAGYAILGGRWHGTLVMKYHRRKSGGLDKSGRTRGKEA